uniref:Adenine phosphoribosyltransferase n=1 Tax=Anopheles atroparvus TaxID=41427 RepID=A0AAG5D388_ANOAO
MEPSTLHSACRSAMSKPATIFVFQLITTIWLITTFSPSQHWTIILPISVVVPVVSTRMSNEYSDNVELIKQHIGEYPDFPKKGILFKDIFTALRNGEVCKAIKSALLSYVRDNCPDVEVIVGLEARGFLFSLLIAAELGVACVPIRKKGKLPGKCVQQEYQLEYGTDVFEAQEGSITRGQKVLVIDDLLATGGTMDAANKLIQQLGGVIERNVVVIELTQLGGRKKLEASGSKVHSFIQYDDIE